METMKLNTIDCEGMHVVATVESSGGEEHPIYYPATFLINVKQGQLNLDIDGKVYIVKEGEFCLVRKYTHGKYFKTFEDNKDGFKEQMFVLQDEFIKDVIMNFDIPKDFMPFTKKFVKIPKSPVLKGLMKSVEPYFEGEMQIDRNLIRIKTMEAIHGLLLIKPEMIHIFHEFSAPARADLEKFMEHNFMHKLTLDEMARMSGRSAATFNRDFRKIYSSSPHKWIKEKRLNLAKSLLIKTQRTASDIYLDVGFEDLSHFSRSFKQMFGVNPSEVKAMA
jgi:AraC-like DNA-binding protein